MLAYPNFKYLVNHGSHSKEVRSVFPTLTYPIHTSIITGVHPDRHGVIHNHPLQPQVADDHRKRWYWYVDQVQAPSLYDFARTHALKTASILWPVSGNAKIEYNLPEIVALPGENQTWKILQAGTPLFLLRTEMKFRKYRNGVSQPQLDDFTTRVACDLIRRQQPELLLLHLISLDTFRHAHGVQSDKTAAGYRRYDESIGEIIQATRAAGIFAETTFFLVSDHGQIDCRQYASLNAWFAEAGLLKVLNPDPEHFAIDYRAYAQSTGLGAFIYLKPDLTPEEVAAMERVLERLKEERVISRVFRGEELARRHAAPDYDIAVEAFDHTYLTDSIYWNLHLKKLSLPEAGEAALRKIFGDLYFANHGYDPFKPGYLNVFVASGPDIREKYDLGPMETVDIAPTAAKVFAKPFYACDGRSLDRIFA